MSLGAENPPISPSTRDDLPRLGVFLSGGGRTLENLLERTHAGDLPATIALVVASRECRGADIARAAGVETLVLPGRLSADQVGSLARDHRLDWIVLAGYLKLLAIPPALRGRVVNIHPALLPSFGGPGMHGLHVHQAVLASGARESGCTVHLCDDRYDTGPVILQKRCPVLPDDTPESLAERVFALERNAYPEALVQLLAGRAPEGRRPTTGE
ncbi:MAG: phosphoribosylglycinamide formyltransferase [Phycisphaerales bacterium]